MIPTRKAGIRRAWTLPIGRQRKSAVGMDIPAVQTAAGAFRCPRQNRRLRSREKPTGQRWTRTLSPIRRTLIKSTISPGFTRLHRTPAIRRWQTAITTRQSRFAPDTATPAADMGQSISRSTSTVPLQRVRSRNIPPDTTTPFGISCRISWAAAM